MTDQVLRLGYADPPYLGCCGLYDHHHPDGLCWDDLTTHEALFARLEESYDGWVVHASSPSLPLLLPLVPAGARIMAWVKPFAAFKRNVPVAYAWEPVIVKAARKPVVSGRVKPLRDWLAESITLKKGLTGAKPEKVCRWMFECLGAQPQDDLVDLYTGTGAVSAAWSGWQADVLAEEAA